MDIERLKEDIRNVEYDLEYGEEQNQGRIAVNVNCLRSLIDFANEAIARQSVKSEEVAEAIEYYVFNLTERLRDGKDEVTKRFETVITALQAYQPWIRVSERMPTEDEFVLCYCEKIWRYRSLVSV